MSVALTTTPIFQQAWEHTQPTSYPLPNVGHAPQTDDICLAGERNQAQSSAVCNLVNFLQSLPPNKQR